MTLSDLPIRDLVEARVRSNALYSLYKDARDSEQAYESIFNETLVRHFGLDEEKALETVKRVKAVIDGGEQ